MQKKVEDIKIIGHDDVLGTYLLSNTYQGGTNEETKQIGVGKRKLEMERDGTEYAMRFSLISKQMGYVMGQVLTTLEATIENERQLKALKSIIKGQFSSQISWIYEQCGTPEEEMNYLPDPTE